MSQRPSGVLLSASVNFPFCRNIFCHFPSAFCVARRHSVNFYYLFMRPGDFLSTFVNFTCRRETFRQLLSTFCTAVRFSVNFRQLSMRPEDCPSIFIMFRTPVHFCRPSVCPGDLPLTSSDFLCCRETFRQLPSTLCAARRHSLISVNFLFRQKIFHQLSMRPEYLLSTSVSFPYSQKTFC